MLQKRAIRAISRARYRDHTDPLFNTLGLLKLQDINKYAFSKFMFRWYHSFVCDEDELCMLPSIFRNFFRFNHTVHSHDTRQSHHLYLPTSKTSLGATWFQYRAPQIWNSILRAEINTEVSEAVFTNSIKQCIRVGLI